MIAYDDLLISFTRTTSTDYQATVQQRELLVEGGPFPKPERFSAARIEEIRQEYIAEIEKCQVLALMNLPYPPQDARKLLALGFRVGEVLPEQTRRSLLRALDRARKRRYKLRIVLEVHPDALELFTIPWELIALPHDRQDLREQASASQPDVAHKSYEGDFLLLDADVALVRQVQGVGEALPLELGRPLRLQAFVAQPAGGEPINMQLVEQAIQQVSGGISEAMYTGPGTLLAMQDRLRQYTPQIVHILCHGYQNDSGEVVRHDLLFTHTDGYIQRVSVFDLAPTLTLAGDLQLIVLHACHSASASSSTESANAEDGAANRPRRVSESIALGLLRKGVRAVVAFQGEVGQAPAAAFVHVLYAQLAAGQSIDQAVANGRIAMQAASGMVEWSLPVVYRGHEQPEPSTVLTRLSDRVETGIRHPGVQRTVRAGMVALVLLLVLAGIMRWVMLPAAPVPQASFLPPMTVWVSMGVLSPAIIAAAQRGVRKHTRLDASMRQKALLSQWAGAYLGYATWSTICLGIGAVLVILDLAGLTATVSFQIGFLVAAVLSSWLIAYMSARIQVKSALAIAPYNPELFDLRSQWVLFVAALLLLVLPYSLFWSDGVALAWIMRPVSGAFILAIMLLTITHWMGEDL